MSGSSKAENGDVLQAFSSKQEHERVLAHHATLFTQLFRRPAKICSTCHGCTLDCLPDETLLYIAQHLDAPSDLVSFGQSNRRLWSNMLPETHEAKLRKMRSYVSELREAAPMIEMPQHAKEVASMTQLPFKGVHLLLQNTAQTASKQLAGHADEFVAKLQVMIQDYSDVYDAMVTNAMSASLEEVPAMTLPESHVAVALICWSRRKHNQASDKAEQLQTLCRQGLEQLHLGVSTLQSCWSVAFVREWLANQQN